MLIKRFIQVNIILIGFDNALIYSNIIVKNNDKISHFV